MIELTYASRYPGLGPAAPYKDATIIFTHIPKAAGTTLDHILYALAFRSRAPWKRFYGHFHKSKSYRKETAYENFENYSDKSLARLKYITGHLPYGVHNRLHGDYLYITILREPLSRCVSDYRFRERRGLFPKDLSIEELFEYGYLIDNLQVRQLGGETDISKPCDERMLQRALDNLKNYGFVGLTDMFNEVIRFMITLQGWPDVIYEKSHTAPDKMGNEEHRALCIRLDKYHQYDKQLYQYVKESNCGWKNGVLVSLGNHASPESVNHDKIVLVSRSMIPDNKCAVMNRDEYNDFKEACALKGITITEHGPV